MSPARSLLDSIAKLRILVVGDLMLDHYIWGDVHRISPEAPVPVIHASRETWAAGGAANVALNLAALGVTTELLGCIGDDDSGNRLRTILKEKQIKLIEDQERPNRPATIVKTRVMARSQQVCRIDHEQSRGYYRLDELDPLMSAFDRSLRDCDAVIVSDYAKGVVTQSLLDRIHIVRRSSKRNRPFIAVDSKPCNSFTLRGASLITPNRQEALELAGIAAPPPDEEYPLTQVCRRLHEQYSPETLVVTLGAEGMAVSRNGTIDTVLPTQAREVFDVSGAGDTVIATLTAAMAAGAAPVEAAQLANAAAGCVVAHMGTVPVNREELINFLAQ